MKCTRVLALLLSASLITTQPVFATAVGEADAEPTTPAPDTSYSEPATPTAPAEPVTDGTTAPSETTAAPETPQTPVESEPSEPPTGEPEAPADNEAGQEGEGASTPAEDPAETQEPSNPTSETPSTPTEPSEGEGDSNAPTEGETEQNGEEPPSVTEGTQPETSPEVPEQDNVQTEAGENAEPGTQDPSEQTPVEGTAPPDASEPGTEPPEASDADKQPTSDESATANKQDGTTQENAPASSADKGATAAPGRVVTTREVVTNPELKKIEITHPVTINDKGQILVPKDGTLADFYVPEKIGGHAVTNITANAFRGTAYFKTVIVPASITEIGANAFADCDGLEYIILLDRVDAKGMSLGKNWAGDAEVVFEKVVEVTTSFTPIQSPSAPAESTEPEPSVSADQNPDAPASATQPDAPVSLPDTAEETPSEPDVEPAQGGGEAASAETPTET